MSKAMTQRKMARRVAALTAVAAVLLAPSQAVRAQAGGGAESGSQQQAIRILDRGIEAAGGWAAVARTTTFFERMSLVQLRHGQAVRPGGPVDPGRPVWYAISGDADLRTLVAEAFLTDTGRTPAGRLVRASGTWRMMRFPQNTVIEMEDTTLVQDRVSVATFTPGVLKTAREHAATLRYVERADGPRGPEEVITFVGDHGQPTTLAFSKLTGDLVRLTRPYGHPLFGDLTLSIAFDDFRPTGGLVVPHKISADLPGVFHAEAICTEVVPGAPLDTSLLATPEGAVPDPRVSSSGKRHVELFPGVHHLLNIVQGYNALYVEQDAGVFVVEAPGGLPASEEILADVAARVPGKTVRGLVLTHHHHDHAAGLWTYIARGIPIITTPGNRAFVAQVAAAPRRARGAARAEVDLVDGRKTIGRGANRFELIDVGPNPHANEILVAYFPERRLLYVPDIYGYFPGFTPPPLLLSFAERLDSLKLDIQTVLTAHTDPDTIEGLRSMVQRVREAR